MILILGICPFGIAHMDLPKGDINLDGKITDDAKFKSDFYPNSAYEVIDGIHAYSECSSKGTCDRSTGTCVCFNGYEGHACQRLSCPTSSAGVCSGHGTCETIQDLTSAVDFSDYFLWDYQSTMGCKCDGGYTGPDCSIRICKHGVDPNYLDTKKYPKSNSFILGWENDDLPASDIEINQFYGNFTLNYEDSFNKVWTTTPIPFVHTTVCHNIRNALSSLPNNVFPDDSVVVTPVTFRTADTRYKGCNIQLTKTFGRAKRMYVSKFTSSSILSLRSFTETDYDVPTSYPTAYPSASPTSYPTAYPSASPTSFPTANPTIPTAPLPAPTVPQPTYAPTFEPFAPVTATSATYSVKSLKSVKDYAELDKLISVFPHGTLGEDVDYFVNSCDVSLTVDDYETYTITTSVPANNKANVVKFAECVGSNKVLQRIVTIDDLAAHGITIRTATKNHPYFFKVVYNQDGEYAGYFYAIAYYNTVDDLNYILKLDVLGVPPHVTSAGNFDITFDNFTPDDYTDLDLYSTDGYLALIGVSPKFTNVPTLGPTDAPSSAPTTSPTDAPTSAPTPNNYQDAPTDVPTSYPTSYPTNPPTISQPTFAPTEIPTSFPTIPTETRIDEFSPVKFTLESDFSSKLNYISNIDDFTFICKFNDFYPNDGNAYLRYTSDDCLSVGDSVVIVPSSSTNHVPINIYNIVRIDETHLYLDYPINASKGDFNVYKFNKPEKAYEVYSQCSSRGICDESTGICSCFNGFKGDNCDCIYNLLN